MKDAGNGKPRRAGRRALAAGILAAAAIAALPAGCGGRRLGAGTVPFPSEKPVFLDRDGQALRDLPAATEPLRLVVLDFPWCPPCAEALKAAGEASASLPRGSVRIYRILFDRERSFSREGAGVVPPLRPAAGDAAEAAPDAFEAVTLTALPDAFRTEYEIGQAPVVLLLSAGGTVIRRWTGHSPSLSAAIAEELRRAGGTDHDSSEPPPP